MILHSGHEMNCCFKNLQKSSFLTKVDVVKFHQPMRPVLDVNVQSKVSLIPICFTELRGDNVFPVQTRMSRSHAMVEQTPLSPFSILTDMNHSKTVA